MIPKLTFTAFIAFWTYLFTVAALSALAPDSVADEPETVRTINASELAEHATLDDCWMAIEGAVYDLTDYLPDHPTPPALLIPWCGRDATEGMRTKGYGRDHSATAWNMLDAYKVGTLEIE